MSHQGFMQGAQKNKRTQVTLETVKCLQETFIENKF